MGEGTKFKKVTCNHYINSGVKSERVNGAEMAVVLANNPKRTLGERVRGEDSDGKDKEGGGGGMRG